MKKKIPLEGQEKIDFLIRQKAEKQALSESTQKAKRKGFIEEDEDDDEGADQTTSVGDHIISELSQHKHDIMSRDLNKGQEFFKKTKTYPMFPSFEKRIRFDDYGEVIRPEDFVIIEVIEAETRRDGEIDGKVGSIK
jgi:cleavage and polyadenylation specificity factor subunit 2